MTTINVGAAVRVRGTFRDGGKLYDPRAIAVEVSAGGVTRRLLPAGGDVTRESQGVYSVVVGSGSGPVLVVTFMDLQTGAQAQQRFDVVPSAMTATSRSDASIDAVRARARQANERDAAEARARREESETSKLAAELRDKAQRDAAQELRDRDTAQAAELARRRRLQTPFQRR